MFLVVLNQAVFNPAALLAIKLISSDISHLQKTALQFEPQLHHLLMQPELPEDSTTLQQRIIAAFGDFIPALEKLRNNIEHCSAKTENKLAGLDFNNLLFELHIQRLLATAYNYRLPISFKVVKYLKHKRNYIIPPFHGKAYTTKANQSKSNNSIQNLHKKFRKKKK